MFKEDQEQAAHCRELTEAVDKAVAWVDRNRELVRKEADPLIAELHKAKKRFRKYEIAALRKMCVGIFGPSQSGKSYLVSALAKGQDGKLTADFDGALTPEGNLPDFLADINPGGGRESTGLVTRFTLTKPAWGRPGFPVHLRLHSEADVIQIITNTYFSDFVHEPEVDGERIVTLVSQFAARARPGVGGSFTQDDTTDIQEYLKKSCFVRLPRVHALEKSYWPAVVTFAHQLSPQDRIKLFSVIWDEVEPLTWLYQRLQGAIEALGHADEAVAPISALMPRDASIIDISTLKGLGEDSRGQADLLDIVTREGKQVALHRTEVTALTAEITVVMTEKPDDFFEHTDLLDFPGYRSRLQTPNIRKELEKKDTGATETLTALELAFLRGKVDFLFQRYCAEKELTSLLLCIADGNQEVQSLPAVIEEWIADTHGETPESRTDVPVTLFFVLSKFDKECQFKAGADRPDDYQDRWNNRVHSSLLSFFGATSEWPTQWCRNGAFNNIFLIRNPNMRATDLFDYSTGEELTKAGDDFIEKLRVGFHESELVRNHFPNPAQSWEAALTPSDGGVGYLRACLRPKCNPELKRGQISSRLNEEKRRIATRLNVFFKTDDKEAERKQKELLARTLATKLAGCVQGQRLGELLHIFSIHDQQLFEIFLNNDQTPVDDGSTDETSVINNNNAIIGKAIAADDLLGDIFGSDFDADIDGLGTTTSTMESPTKPKLDEADVRVGQVETFWLQHMRAISDDSLVQTYFGMSADEVASLVQELIVGATRLKLWEQIADELRKAMGFHVKRERLFWKQASRAAHMVNAYISWFGMCPRETSETQRTVMIAGKPKLVFARAAVIQGMPIVGEEQLPFDTNYFRDWIVSVVHLITKNLEFDGANTINVEENNILNGILKSVAVEDTRS